MSLPEESKNPLIPFEAPDGMNSRIAPPVPDPAASSPRPCGTYKAFEQIMGNALLHKISYQQLRDDSRLDFDDTLGMVSNYLIPSVKRTLLANPNLNDDSLSAMNLIVSDGVVVGRNMLMPTKVKAGNDCFAAQSGGSYEVSEAYQNSFNQTNKRQI